MTAFDRHVVIPDVVNVPPVLTYLQCRIRSFFPRASPVACLVSVGSYPTSSRLAIYICHLREYQLNS